ncbi:zona pellucida sperm-binding protein 3-like [Denticeps clupeoides]|uniref:zona pellucida sperm-binding protein 3-like n=1 Tax=Denticeps clupeoides TaxID=299321 RepID=UPI0010A4B365|nr:zona pellucida sperm-binding protein 3-like [Denticeps clupeoides]
MPPVPASPPFVPGMPPVPASPPFVPGMPPVPASPPFVPGMPPVPASPPFVPGMPPVPASPPFVPGMPPVPASPPFVPGMPPVPASPPFVPGMPPVPASPPFVPGMPPVPASPPFVPGMPPVPARPPFVPGMPPVPARPPFVPGMPPVPARPPFVPGMPPVPARPPFVPGMPPVPARPPFVPGMPPFPASPPFVPGMPPVPANPPFVPQVPARPPFVPGMPQVPASPPIAPLPQGTGGQLQDPGSVQQQLLGPVKELTWKFPQMPVEPTSPPVQFQLREPVSVSSVAATCDENMVHVQVKKDLFGSGDLIQASDITLGGCGVTGEDSVAQLLYFQSYLQSCGSQVVMTNDTLVYSFSLTYVPTAISHTSAPIVRTSGAVIGIECHYLRLHNVSSNALQPAWIPYAATKIAEELLVFSLKLMTDDWQFERPSNIYYMGDLINFEASVKQYNHVPLRVFVDTCVVTAVPDAAAAPSYLFIQNHGCLVDSKLTGSSSRFLPRTQDFKLQFQLEAFRFQQGDTGSLFFTCLLKATAAASPTDAEHKACSFVGQKWAGAGGEDQLCSCCDGTCGSRKARDLTSVFDSGWEKELLLGPVFIRD